MDIFIRGVLSEIKIKRIKRKKRGQWQSGQNTVYDVRLVDAGRAVQTRRLAAVVRCRKSALEGR